jgi:arsenate reductase (thioredoxin)
MQADSTDRRLSPRSTVSERIRVRSSDPRQAEKICNTSNQSQTGLYFMTATGYFVPRMEVFVTRRFRPHDPASREEKGLVVRVQGLGGGHIGVAIHMESSLATRVLFVCLGNSCRSPMAEALARHLAPDVIAASSAGVTPLGYVSPSTRTVLEEIGISIAGQESKPLNEKDVAGADLLINMTGGPVFHGSTPVENWQVQDPFGRDLAAYRSTRDEIERRVMELAKRLRASAATRRTSERIP